MESNWPDGIRLLMRSNVTQNMVKCLTPEERSYFVENIIGDIITQPSSLLTHDTKECLKEELSIKPYAGLFIVYLLEKFETLSDIDQVYWEESVKNLYLEELQLLSKSNQSNFSNFILNYYVNRKTDRLYFLAKLFID